MTLVAGKGPAAFRTISEAADELGVPTHVLRFWETKFSFIRPMKRAGGRRFYRPRDLDVLKGIRDLLHQEGYTIKGVQRLHKEQGLKRLLVAGGATPAQAEAEALLEREEVERSAPPAPAELDASTAGSTPSTMEAVGTITPMRRPRPMLTSSSRDRLEAILHDLHEAKSAIDAVLPTPLNDVD